MEVKHQPSKKSKLTWYILLGMVLGIIAGYVVHENYPPSTQKVFADNIKFLSKIQQYLEDYANKATASPFEVTEHKIPKEDMKILRNHYLHYNATAGLVNAPEPERRRGIIKN